MKYIEVGTEKYLYVDEDIDTIMVRSMDNTKLKNGFTIIKKVYSGHCETMRCKLVSKEDVTAYYNDWDETHSYFGTMRCSCDDIDGRVCVSTYNEPTEYANEFTYEEFDEDRGTEFPPLRSHRYYAIVDADDNRLKRDIIVHKHIDYAVNHYGISHGMTMPERTEALLKYLEEKVGKDCLDDFEQLYSLLLGCYGYKIPDETLSTNIDLVFRRVIPNAYLIRKKRGGYLKDYFCNGLMTAIINGYCSLRPGEKIIFEDGKKKYVSKDYQYYMCLQFHLKLIELHKAGVEPYTDLDFKNVSYWLEKRYSEFMDKHEPVSWNGNVVCEDLGDFTRWAMKELEYFKKFELNPTPSIAQPKYFTPKIDTPKTASTTPVARFNVTALALFANFAATLAQKSVDAIQKIRHHKSGTPPITK